MRTGNTRPRVLTESAVRGRTKTPLSETIRGDPLIVDVKRALDIPAPVNAEGGLVPKVVAWVGSSSLRVAFSDPNPSRQPGLITATVELVDDQGFAVQDQNFQPLKLSAPIRSL